MALALVCGRGFDRDHEAATGIFDRVRSTWNAVADVNSPQFEHRRARLYSLMSRVQPIVAAPHEAVGAARIRARTPAGLWVDAAVAIRFRRSDVDTVIGKFVRGFHYYRNGEPLALEAKITCFDPPEETMREVGQLQDRGSLSKGLHYRLCQDSGRAWG